MNFVNNSETIETSELGETNPDTRVLDMMEGGLVKQTVSTLLLSLLSEEFLDG